jgi:hypothetical protein
LIDFINIFARATAAPAAVLINLVLGGSAKTVFPEFASSGDVRARPAAITVERPELGLQGIAGGAVKRTEISVAGGSLSVERRIEEPVAKELGGPRGAVVLYEDTSGGLGPVGTQATGSPGPVEPFSKMEPRERLIHHGNIRTVAPSLFGFGGKATGDHATTSGQVNGSTVSRLDDEQVCPREFPTLRGAKPAKP